MKTTLLVAVLAISFVACKKDPFTVPDVTPQPSLQAKVYPFVNQPREAALGDTNTIFYVGERVTIYVPYEMTQDYFNTATLIVSDEEGNTIATLAMLPSTDMMANELNIPQQLQGADFVFANVDLGEEFAGKTLSIKAQVSGGQTVSDDDVKNAFTVEL